MKSSVTSHEWGPMQRMLLEPVELAAVEFAIHCLVSSEGTRPILGRLKFGPPLLGDLLLTNICDAKQARHSAVYSVCVFIFLIQPRVCARVRA